MGELADAIQDRPEDIERHGGSFRYDSPIELLQDLVVLRRVVPTVTIMVSDYPKERSVGYAGYWRSPNILDAGEVSVRLYIRMLTLNVWYSGAPQPLATLAHQFLGPAAGRQRFIQIVEEVAASGGHLVTYRGKPVDDAPAPEPYVPTRWERLLKDDEPL